MLKIAQVIDKEIRLQKVWEEEDDEEEDEDDEDKNNREKKREKAY